MVNTFTQLTWDGDTLDDARHLIRLAVREAIDRLSRDANDADDHTISEAARIAARRAFRTLFDKRPITRVHLVRLD